MSTTLLPPQLLLSAMMRKYPDAAKDADSLRVNRPISWPDWCFLPMAGPLAIVTQGRDLSWYNLSSDQKADIARLTAALAWRPGQDIVRFDRDVYDALIKTPLDDAIPEELLYRLPAWCLYVELHDAPWDYHGFFVHLEYDINTQRHELRLLFLHQDAKADEYPLPLVLHLGTGSIQKGVDRYIAEAVAQDRKAAALYGRTETLTRTTEACAKAQALVDKLRLIALSLTLYLCSTAPEYAPQADGTSAPNRAAPKKVKAGWRIFPPDRPRIWHVGKETGIKIRAARSGETGTHAGPRPHIRRAHWHTYWTGKKKWGDGENPVPQTPQLRWLAPIAVAMQDDASNDA